MKLQTVFRNNMAMNTLYYLNDIKTIEVSKIREIPLGVNMQDVFISSDLCYHMSASPVPLMLGGV